MKHTDFFNMIVQESGVIKTDDEGNSVCTSCHGTGKHYEASVQHHKNCAFMKAVNQLTKLMPDKNELQVENSITVGMMLPYLSEMYPEEIEKAKDLADCMQAAENPAQRAHVADLVTSWCRSVKQGILAAVIQSGLPDSKALLTFRNYLIFEKSNTNESLRIVLALLSLNKNIEALLPTFYKLLTGKYPNYKR